MLFAQHVVIRCTIDLVRMFGESDRREPPSDLLECDHTPAQAFTIAARSRPLVRIHLASFAARRACQVLSAACTLYQRHQRRGFRRVGLICFRTAVLPDCRSCGSLTASWCGCGDEPLCSGCTGISCRICNSRDEQQEEEAQLRFGYPSWADNGEYDWWPTESEAEAVLKQARVAGCSPVYIKLIASVPWCV